MSKNTFLVGVTICLLAFGWLFGRLVDSFFDYRQNTKTIKEQSCTGKLESIYMEGVRIEFGQGDESDTLLPIENKQKVEENLDDRLWVIRKYLEECVQTNY